MNGEGEVSQESGCGSGKTNPVARSQLLGSEQLNRNYGKTPGTTTTKKSIVSKCSAGDSLSSSSSVVNRLKADPEKAFPDI